MKYCYSQKKDYTQYVNPFVGTAPLTDPDFIGYTPPRDWRVWAGLTFPGSSLPNAMVQLSPITQYGSGAGYEYEDDEIIGFTHTNKGHWNLCHIPIMPISSDASHPFKSHYSHDQEKASPAYYEVDLKDYHVKARLTSTLRCGYHAYTYENANNRRILFDLGRANHGVSDWKIEKKDSKTLAGFQRTGGEKIYFYAELSHDITDLSTQDEGKRDGYATLTVADGGAKEVTLKIALSFVSIENAKENLKQEIGSQTFDQIHTKGQQTWNDLLSTIEVKGGTDKQRNIFYSSFYRSFLWPALRSDINGQFIDRSGNTRTEDFNYYTNPSLWDTFRNKLVLLSMVSPEVTNDVIKSLIDQGEITGFIPTFFHGDHAAPFIIGSYLRGVNDFDIKKAYELLLNNATKEGGTRPHITEYIEKGYISTPEREHPHVETKAKAGVSKTLEYAYDDYAISLLAKHLDDQKNFEVYSKRAQNYKNVFDSATRFMKGKLEDGSWVKNFDPQYPYYEYMYREANAWQVSFFVTHDMPGLVDLYGGKKAFEEKLDSLFTLPWNPNHIARNVSSFIGQYCHGNQPDHEAPFAYYFADKPEKSQQVLDNILNNFYGVGEYGLALSGMDDAGEMSAWYVFSALGLYPFSSVDNEYIVSVPLFDEVVWHTKEGKTLSIKKEGPSRELKKIKVDGKTQKGYFVPYHLFENGANINIITK
ncbi:GH92 family glycosyl hydrolase [Fulvivirga ligni]|nr:GH92 family glycosyl hydrolase [Fulvivirga ligni]